MKPIGLVNDDAQEMKTLCAKYDLLCTGNPTDLQWLGTNLFQKLVATNDSEIGCLYGKQIHDIESFCYQLEHCTPWGFSMGRNFAAINDVLFGENNPSNKYLIWYDAQHLLEKDYRFFQTIFNIIFRQVSEHKTRNINFKTVFMFSGVDRKALKKLLTHKSYKSVRFVEVLESCPISLKDDE